LTEQKFFVFSLSEEDEAFDHKDMGKAVRWLRDKQDEPNPVCYFRKKSLRDAPSGSIMLFSFDTKIFGQATLKGTKEEIPLKDKRRSVYKHFVRLDPATIEIFSRYPTKKEPTKKMGMNFSQVFTYFNYKQYQKILRLSRL